MHVCVGRAFGVQAWPLGLPVCEPLAPGPLAQHCLWLAGTGQCFPGQHPRTKQGTHSPADTAGYGLSTALLCCQSRSASSERVGMYVCVCVCISVHVCYTARQNQVVLGCPASTVSSGLFSLWGCCCPVPCAVLCVRQWQLGTAGISLQSRTCPCGLLLHSRAPAGDAEPPGVSGGSPPLQHCW